MEEVEMASKKLIGWLVIGAAVALVPLPALAENPVFGTAKHKTLTTPAMKKVVGQGYYADQWGRSGRQALANADVWAYYGIVYYSYSAENSYYWNAYSWARAASNRLYNAWLNAGY
jgi:hypothetical protein